MPKVTNRFRFNSKSGSEPSGLLQIKTLQAQDCRAAGRPPALLTCHAGAQSRADCRGPPPLSLRMRPTSPEGRGPSGRGGPAPPVALNILQPREAAQASAGPTATSLRAKGGGGKGVGLQASSPQRRPPAARRTAERTPGRPAGVYMGPASRGCARRLEQRPAQTAGSYSPKASGGGGAGRGFLSEEREARRSLRSGWRKKRMVGYSGAEEALSRSSALTGRRA